MKNRLILGLIFLSFSLIVFLLINNAHSALADQGGVVISAQVAAVCGDGQTEIGEACDDGANNGQYGYCKVDCSGSGPRCGDGVVHAGQGEECDDGNVVSNDGCSASCVIEESFALPPATPPTFNPYYPSFKETKVIFKGRAYPLAEIVILQDGRIVKTITADQQADFETEIVNLSGGLHHFGFWAEDNQGRQSITFSLAVTVSESMITTIKGILLPPTIELLPSSLKHGEVLNILGQTTPQADIQLDISQEGGSLVLSKRLTADENGDWLYVLDSSGLEKGSYFVKAKAETKQALSSIYSRIVSFSLDEKESKLLCPSADLNNDGRVDLVDFSILLYWWGANNVCCDQNQDDAVDLIDFSIMMYYWTG